MGERIPTGAPKREIIKTAENREIEERYTEAYRRIAAIYFGMVNEIPEVRPLLKDKREMIEGGVPVEQARASVREKIDDIIAKAAGEHSSLSRSGQISNEKALELENRVLAEFSRKLIERISRNPKFVEGRDARKHGEAHMEPELYDD